MLIKSSSYNDFMKLANEKEVQKAITLSAPFHFCMVLPNTHTCALQRIACKHDA